MSRPNYPQTHPAMRAARNIVNQILDESGADITTRQRINDDCDQFTAWMLEKYLADQTAKPPMTPDEAPVGTLCAVGHPGNGAVAQKGTDGQWYVMIPARELYVDDQRALSALYVPSDLP